MHANPESTHSHSARLGMRLWLPLVVAATLIMGAGWGIRGSFGHSRGAMMPGAMLGLTLAACSMRRDWWRRSAILGLFSAIGWGFGGASSYGLLIGYSMGGTYTNSLYGYASLFLVGSLYCGIGAGLFAIGITAKRSLLESSLVPLISVYSAWLLLTFSGARAWSLELVAKDPDNPLQTVWLYDTLWLPAIVALLVGAAFSLLSRQSREVGNLIVMLSAGWLLAMALLIGLLGLRINPSRGDAWAGCLGVQLGLIIYFWRQHNRAALMMTAYGLLAGGLGFAIGDFMQALGRGKWGPIGAYPVLQEFGYWTVMEQVFGYIMGAGTALGCYRLIRGRLAEPEEDTPTNRLSYFAVFALLGLLFAFNSLTNIAAWLRENQMPELTLGYPSLQVLAGFEVFALAVLLFGIVRTYHGRLQLLPHSLLGKSQVLCILVIGMVLGLYLMLPKLALPTVLMFFVALGVGVGLLLNLPPQPLPSPTVGDSHAADSSVWRLGWRHYLLWVLVPLVLLLLAYGTMQLEIPVKQIRFIEG